VDERLNENRNPLHSVLREIQETDYGDLADLTILGAAFQADGECQVRGHGLRHRPFHHAIPKRGTSP
jgi:hypothetical protein